jgi:hypothetical protein
MERNVRDPGAGGLALCENFRREMQARGRRGYRARLPGENGLVAFPVGGFVGALDIRRQRYVAGPPEPFVKIAIVVKT